MVDDEGLGDLDGCRVVYVVYIVGLNGGGGTSAGRVKMLRS